MGYHVVVVFVQPQVLNAAEFGEVHEGELVGGGGIVFYPWLGVLDDDGVAQGQAKQVLEDYGVHLVVYWTHEIAVVELDVGHLRQVVHFALGQGLGTAVCTAFYYKIFEVHVIASQSTSLIWEEVVDLAQLFI